MEPDIKDIVSQSRASIDKNDLEILLNILGGVLIENILEIGTWRGFSMENWSSFFPYTKIITIEKDDKNEECVEIDYEKYHYLWGTDSHSPETFIRVEEMFGGNWVDFLFIDGDHSLEGVKKDYETYEKLVRKGGVIVFHDVCYHADGTEEVDLLWNKLKRLHNYVEIKCSPESTGIGIVFK